MTLKLTRTTVAALTFAMTALASWSKPVTAQTCEYLNVVGAEGTEVTKTVSLPGLLFINSNWDTDFVLNEGASYNYFVVNFLSESGTSYDIDVFLKYPDDSVDASYRVRERNVPEGEPITIRAESRVRSDPYQVNVRVGGFNAEGNTYTASVIGCR